MLKVVKPSQKLEYIWDGIYSLDLQEYGQACDLGLVTLGLHKIHIHINFLKTFMVKIKKQALTVLEGFKEAEAW